MCFPILSLDIIKAMIDSASLSFTEFLKKVDSGLMIEFMHVPGCHIVNKIYFILILKSFFYMQYEGDCHGFIGVFGHD